MNFDLAQKVALCLRDAEKNHTTGEANGNVDTVLDVGKDGDKHADKVDDAFQRRHPPKLVNRIWLGNQVQDRMDDDCLLSQKRSYGRRKRETNLLQVMHPGCRKTPRSSSRER